MERDCGGVGFASGNDDIGTPTRGDRGELIDQATLTESGIPDNPDEAAAIGVEYASQPIQLGIAAQHQALVAAQHRPVGLHREELSCGRGRVGAFDSNVFDGPEPGGVLDEARCGERAHDAAWRGGCLHALRHSDGMADCGVSAWT